MSRGGMPYLDLDGEQIYYALQRNNPTGIRVLLLHGAGENHLVWPIGLRRLPGTIVYAIDLPGHGKSTGKGRDTIEGYVDWLAAFTRALSIERALLIGHSMGGGVAQQFALEHSEQTAGLVLIASSARLRVAPQLLSLIQSDFEAAVEQATQCEWGPLAPEPIKALGKQQLLTTDPAVMLNDFRACDAFDVRERLSEIKAPTLIVGGEVDQMTPFKHLAFLSDRLPHARLVCIPQAGHMVMLEAEEMVTRAVTEFVQEILTAHG